MRILSARYANADGTAIEAQTDADGAVMIVPERRDLWALAQAWILAGGQPAEFTAAEPQPAPATLVAAELTALKRLMVEKGVATEEEIATAIEASREVDFSALSDATAQEVLGR